MAQNNTKQSTTTTMTVRLSTSVKNSLAQMAKSENRSKSFLAAEAIEGYIAIREEQIAGIKRAIASADAGKGVPHEKVKAWVSSWGSDNELPMPTV